MLAALGMNLAAVGTDIERLAKTAQSVNDSAALVQELSKEVRTISHLFIRLCSMKRDLLRLSVAT